MKVVNHNIEADLGLHSYRKGINKFSDLTNKEFSSIYMGNRVENKNNSSIFKSDTKTLPKSVDWRTKGIVTPVKNQYACGSCWAFSAVASLEGQHAKKYGKLVSLSEQNLVDCSRKYGNYGCNGGYVTKAFEYIKDNNGVDTETSYPYVGFDDECHFESRSVGANVTGFTNIESGSEEALQQATATIGPISVAIDATDFQDYHGGIFDDKQCETGSMFLHHAVTVIGYGVDEKTGAQYWLVKNSWGSDWGEQGYIRMSRNKNNQCGIATSATFPLV
ncbi:Cathepsin L-like protein [Leptotrombidium deliense]|uniref:Cathepsin L-like protein n=1 Tax=Leptotrombidium deliense TaxID=299467 RepID=A0A443SC66_9ACAR|nr:Cathepsin L-like protein [Leptotrombidium deliense]